jgi:MFS family permease
LLRLTLLGGLLSLARFSEAFLVLRAADVGIAVTYVPLVLAVMSVVYALTAYPAGRLSDRMPRTLLLAVGLAMLVLADVVLATAHGPAMLFAGVALWGLHMGLTQGIVASMIADAAPAEHRGTAFGMFNLVSGAALLAASVLAGALWDLHGPAWTFWTGAGCAVFTLLLMPALTRIPNRNAQG